MKLIIQIPCLNEAEHLPATLLSLPRQMPGFDSVEWLVVDDGSTDNTASVALLHGADHVIRLPYNQGLARAFMAGIEAALRAGADVIVNTDADNQYDAGCIPDLVAPILAGRAQIVVGARPIEEIAHFSYVKRKLQRLGSFAVRMASGTNIEDAASGFRAIHRNAAQRLYVFNDFTYTLETIIQAGRKNIPTTSVPIRVNGETRPSRLFRSITSYVTRSMSVILRIALLYRPLAVFASLAALIALPGVIAIIRFLYFYAMGDSRGHIQSLAIAGVLVSVAAIVAMGGLLADLIAANRILLEDLRARHMAESLGKAVAESERKPARHEAPLRATYR
jgi:glycosyltransferase involved in cell wall biosynthesis